MLTVGDIRKAIEGLDDDMGVLLPGHSDGEMDSHWVAREIRVAKAKDGDSWEGTHFEFNKETEGMKPYLIIEHYVAT